jgi:ComF family protein
LCLTCRRHPPEFDFAWSACLYRHGLPGLLHAYKYRQKTFYRHFFGRLMLDFADFYSLDIRRFDLILPVPLHSARFRERGYNQSGLLAAPVACRYDIPCNPRLLIRSRSTPSQTGLTGKERWTNLRSAFKIHPHANVINKNILIIDDLITTGATASQAAATLKDAGAATVGVFTLAATP